MKRHLTAALCLLPLHLPTAAAAQGEGVRGWLSWRGPAQNGTSPETGLVDEPTPGGAGHAWSYPLPGRGTPVVVGTRVIAFGYQGEGKDLQEVVACLDEATGKLIWERRFNDYLSDSVYSRYAVGSATVDPESRNLYVLTTPGLLVALSPDGETVWEKDMQGEFGRLTFPNSRIGSPAIDGELVIVHGITAHWGPQGPAADRFYAFDKHSGQCVWSSTPSPQQPIDASFSMPVFAWEGGRRVLYATTGCGNVVCIDARLGDPLWRFPLSKAGLNSSVVLHGANVLALNGKENYDSSAIGRMVAIKRGGEPAAGQPGPLVLGAEHEVWRNDLVAFTSSPVLVGDRAYVTDESGELACIDAATGKILWQVKLGPDQLHASPAWAEGKLYIPLNNGSFHVIRPSDAGAEVIHKTQLAGNCLGAPAIANGRIYVHTTEQLYCFGEGKTRSPEWPRMAAAPGEPGPPARLQVVPADVLLRPGERTPVSVRVLDAKGNLLSRASEITWKSPANLDLSVDETGSLLARDKCGSGVLTASAAGLTGSARVRVVPGGAFSEGFEGFTLSEKSPDGGTAMAHPPSHWIGVRVKWEVRELDGEKVLARTLNNPLFQRAMGSIGHPASSNYTMLVDIRSDGNKRTLSSAGVVNQRYLIVLKGNHQELEITSNEERIKESVPFAWQAGKWYTLKSRVDVAPDGSGVVRAKCWPRDEPEPEGWTIEVEHAHAHAEGSPGLYGFAPQSRFRVYVDNIRVIPNES
jgi:outer membrane protein assembly factor BamB